MRETVTEQEARVVCSWNIVKYADYCRKLLSQRVKLEAYGDFYVLTYFLTLLFLTPSDISFCPDKMLWGHLHS